MGYLYRDEPEEPSHYRGAQICRNGHVITSDTTYPELMAPRCAECGAETLTACPSCKTQIRGIYHVPGVIGFDHYKAPAFCHNCGEPFPWTEAKKRAWRELVEESEGLSKEDRERLARSIDDLIADTPGTNIAVMRVKKWLARAGNVVGPSVRQIVLEIGTEAVKKSMGL